MHQSESSDDTSEKVKPVLVLPETVTELKRFFATSKACGNWSGSSFLTWARYSALWEPDGLVADASRVEREIICVLASYLETGVGSASGEASVRTHLTPSSGLNQPAPA